MSPNLLEVNQLATGYGEIQVLEGVSLHLKEGERIGLFGPNGHGKTTLLRAISGLIRPWRGSISFKGSNIDQMTPRAIVDLGLIHVSQGNTLFPRMTVLENLHFGAYPKKSWSRRSESQKKVFDLFPRLAERKNQRCSTLSGGERQMLAIGIGLMADLKVLMLDEPTLGLAPLMKEMLSEAIARITAEGIPLILVEQDVEFMMELTDRIYLLEGGRIALESTPDEVDEGEILKMYFGGGD